MAAHAWAVIRERFYFSDEASVFWWEETAPILGTMLEAAGYDIHGQYAILFFYLQFIVGHLGPRPRIRRFAPAICPWESFMTDDHSPLELSWAWDSINSAPKVRFSIEAIGSQAGSAADPFNQLETLELVQKLKDAYPRLSWDLFSYFLAACEHACEVRAKHLPRRTSIGLRFDFHGGRLNAGAYLTLPMAIENPSLGWNFLHDAISNFSQDGVSFPTVEQLHRFLQVTDTGKELAFLGLGIDCVASRESRLKVYLRSQYTSMEKIKAVLTMNGELLHPWTETTLHKLHTLIGLIAPEIGAEPKHRHQTSGMLYNFDIHSNHVAPFPRIYIPVKHYGTNDLEVAEGLAEFQRMEGRTNDEGYADMLRRICTYRRLGDDKGLQTYIAVSPKGHSMGITAYVTPQVYTRLQ